MPKKGGKQSGGGGKGKKVRLTLIKNGDPKCTHLVNVVPTVKNIKDEAGRSLKGIAQKGDHCLYATDGYPLGNDDLASGQTGDIVVVSAGEAFIRLNKAPAGKLYSQDTGYPAAREPLGIASRPEGWNPTAVAQISSVASAFGASAETAKLQLKWEDEEGEETVLTLESKKAADISDWFGPAVGQRCQSAAALSSLSWCQNACQGGVGSGRASLACVPHTSHSSAACS